MATRVHPLLQAPLPQREQKLRLGADYTVAVCFLIPVAAYAFSGTAIPRSQISLGCLICILGLLPMILYLRNADRPPIPFLPMTGLFYVVSCGLPAFYDFSSNTIAQHWYSKVDNGALLLIATALSALYAGYYASRSNIFRLVRPIHLPREFQLSRLALALWMLLLVHFIGLLFPAIAIKLHFDQFVMYAGYVPYGMFFMLWRRGYLRRGQLLILLGIALPVEAMLRFASGSIAPLFLLGLFFLVVVWIERRKISFSFIVCGIILFGVLNYTKSEYRKLTWYSGPFANASSLEKTKLFGQIAVREFASTSARDYSSTVIDMLAARVSVVGFLTYVMDQTPGIVPYWHGETYAVLVYKLIPRAIWPDKPMEQLGYEFTARYSMRSIRDESTSFNVPWIVEMYANFGWSGIIWGMGLIGVLIAFFEAKLNSRHMTTLELMVGATILFDLCYQESNFSLMVGSKALLGLSLYVFFSLALREGTAKHSARQGNTYMPFQLAGILSK